MEPETPWTAKSFPQLFFTFLLPNENKVLQKQTSGALFTLLDEGHS